MAGGGLVGGDPAIDPDRLDLVELDVEQRHQLARRRQVGHR
jgi:hypothetical protein